jgi:CHAT domain-containing protein
VILILQTAACSHGNGNEQKSSGRARARLLLCATGAFSQLPIHAARISTLEGLVGLTDYVVPSYIPTLGVILNARRNYQPIRKSEAKVLLASVPNPYKWLPLPFAEQEVAEIESVLDTASVLRLSDQEGQGATVAGIQEKLPEASILHLACHGHQDPKHPLDSGFVMRDAMLTVSDIMALRLPNVLLAFLSACETAKGDEKQPDQAVHLAAAMLFAGIKSVVGTMWYVLTLLWGYEVLNERP